MMENLALRALAELFTVDSMNWNFPELREKVEAWAAISKTAQRFADLPESTVDTLHDEIEVLDRIGAITFPDRLPWRHHFSEVAEKHLATVVGVLNEQGNFSLENVAFAMTNFLEGVKLGYQNGSLNVADSETALQAESDSAGADQENGVSNVKNTVQQSDGAECDLKMAGPTDFLLLLMEFLSHADEFLTVDEMALIANVAVEILNDKYANCSMVPGGKDDQENPQEDLTLQARQRGQEDGMGTATGNEKTVEKPNAAPKTVSPRLLRLAGAQPEPPTQPVDDEADNYWNFLATGMWEE
jgi:hypothetical protein